MCVCIGKCVRGQKRNEEIQRQWRDHRNGAAFSYQKFLLLLLLELTTAKHPKLKSLTISIQRLRSFFFYSLNLVRISISLWK